MTSTEEFIGETVKSRGLRAVVRRLYWALMENGVDPHLRHPKAQEGLLLLAGLLEGAPAPRFGSYSTPDLFLLSRLLQALRAELLSETSRAETSPDELIELLASVERVNRQLELDATHGSVFTTLLATRGPELVVELAHDLRSPLTSILFLTDALRNGHSGELTDFQRRQLGIIYTAALTTVSVAGDVLELARREDALIGSETSSFVLGEVFDSVLDLARPLVEFKEIELRVRLPRRQRREGYPAGLTRVLLNLTMNAVRFTERGFIELAATEGPGGEVEFSVYDSGPGIHPESADRLYEPFRTNATRDRIGISGAGLGLAICRRLIRAMGGELTYETVIGEGTRFHFTLVVPPSDEPAGDPSS